MTTPRAANKKETAKSKESADDTDFNVPATALDVREAYGEGPTEKNQVDPNKNPQTPLAPSPYPRRPRTKTVADREGKIEDKYIYKREGTEWNDTELGAIEHV